MEKLYHIFISSTYADLKDERRKVSEAVSKAGNVPEGMEIFPASSQKQFGFIQRVIQRCDYYVVIVGGRYGTLTDEEISYTEREYEYAVSLGLPTLAFLHASPGKIEVGKTESDPDKARRLELFKAKLESQSLVDYWANPDELATKAVAALAQEISSNPGVGWIRADKAANTEILEEINVLRKQNEELRAAAKEVRPLMSVENLAGADDLFTINYTYRSSSESFRRDGKLELSWRQILGIIGPDFRALSNKSGVATSFRRYISDVLKKNYTSVIVNGTDQERILMQCELLGWMKGASYQLQGGGQGVFHQLTALGLAETLRVNAVTKTINT